MRQNMKYLTSRYQLREGQLKRFLDIVQQTKSAKPNGVVFFGDSITEMCDLDKYYPEIPIKYNCGISGITSDMLLHFVDEGVVLYQPKKVVLLVGTNDLGNTVMYSPRDIALNIKEVTDIILGNLPDTHIYIVSPLPCDESKQGYAAIHKGLRSLDMLKMIFSETQHLIYHPNVHFINVFDDLTINDLVEDGLHVNHQGYLKLSKKIKEYIL